MPIRPGWRAVAVALLAGIAVFGGGLLGESWLIAVLRLDRTALEWISDAILATGFTVVSLLWLHLRATEKLVLRLERKRVAVETQLQLAADIQRQLLPALPARSRRLQWAARIEPAFVVGGDFYDFLERPDGSVLVIVGDVSGKGVPAALIHVALRALFRQAARETSDPAVIAARLSEGLNEDTGGNPYATAIIAHFEPDSLALTYVNAGHPPGVLLRGGATSLLESNGVPLGLLGGVSYEVRRVELRGGDAGVFLSDGVTEAFESTPGLTAARVLADAGWHSDPRRLCGLLLEAAAASPGPVGVKGWQDDRTVLAFAVDA